MSQIPATHIDDGQKLQADGIIELFQLAPNGGGTLYFKPEADATWQSHLYTGLPCAITGIKKSSDTTSNQPRLTIGQPNLDLSAFKPLIHDGYVDGATLTYRRILLAHLVANSNIAEVMTFRVKRVESYSRSQIILGLSTSSDAMQFTLPNLQFYPPAFPAVML